MSHIRTDPACEQYTETTDDTRGMSCRLCAPPLRPSLTVECPRCKAGVGEVCRTLTTGRTTDTHMARYDALAAKRRRRP